MYRPLQLVHVGDRKFVILMEPTYGDIYRMDVTLDKSQIGDEAIDYIAQKVREFMLKYGDKLPSLGKVVPC